MADFSNSYYEARKCFLTACERHTCSRLKALHLSCGRDLYMDFALLGASGSENLLVHVSGTHGVEGFVGSAIQSKILRGGCELPEGVAVLFIHAVNPYGMAELRRVNENNVDLNRNFLAEGESFSGAPDLYAEICDVINPVADLSDEAVLGLTELYSFEELQVAILTGQYDYPQGLYYGGAKHEESTTLFSDNISDYLSGVKRVLGLEVHSGLGEFASQMLLTSFSDSAKLTRRQCEQLLGESLIEDAADVGGYPVRGGLKEAVVRNYADRQVTWVVQEFGTFAPVQMLLALRAENFWYHKGVDAQHESRLALLEAFCPSDERWRAEVLRQGVSAFNTGLSFLSSLH